MLMTMSCNPVERNLDRMESLVIEADNYGGQYSLEDWEIFVDEYQELQEILSEYKDELSKEDCRRLGQVMAKYHHVLVEYSVRKINNDIRNGGYFVKGYLEGLGIDGGDDSVDSMLGGYADLIDDAFAEVEELFEQ